MTFADGWICLTCWKSNRPRDMRCYGCRTPRDADPAVVVKERHRAVEQSAQPSAGEPVPDTLVAIPVAVFLWIGWLWRKFAIIILVLSALAAISNPISVVFGAAVAAVYYAIGILYRAISNGMRDRAIWAFLVGIAIAGIPTALHLYTLFFVQVPAIPEGLPGWFSTLLSASTVLNWISLTINAAAAICALIGLILAVVNPAPPARRMKTTNG